MGQKQERRYLIMLSEHGIKRFWCYVNKKTEDECWPWTGSCYRDGYGMFSYNKVYYNTAIIAFVIKHQIDPIGLVIRHTCDNPPCCNPKHLIEGTQAENNQDIGIRGRNKSGGSKLHHSGDLSPTVSLTWIEVQRIRYLACFMRQIDILKMSEFQGRVTYKHLNDIINLRKRKEE